MIVKIDKISGCSRESTIFAWVASWAVVVSVTRNSGKIGQTSHIGSSVEHIIWTIWCPILPLNDKIRCNSTYLHLYHYVKPLGQTSPSNLAKSSEELFSIEMAIFSIIVRKNQEKKSLLIPPCPLQIQLESRRMMQSWLGEWSLTKKLLWQKLLQIIPIDDKTTQNGRQDSHVLYRSN